MQLQKSLLRACDWAPGSECECCTISYILFLEPLVARNKPAEWILSVFPNHLLGDAVTGYNLMENSKRREDGLLLQPYSSGTTLRESQTLDDTSGKNFKTEGSIRAFIKIRESTYFWSMGIWTKDVVRCLHSGCVAFKVMLFKGWDLHKISRLIQQVLKLRKNKAKQTSKKKKTQAKQNNKKQVDILAQKNSEEDHS